jgi:hypothetical protein
LRAVLAEFMGWGKGKAVCMGGEGGGHWLGKGKAVCMGGEGDGQERESGVHGWRG